MNIKEQIQNMLDADSKIINEISESNEINYDLKDEYGDITNDMLKDAKYLFDKFDKNGDQFITPLDVDNVLISIETYHLSFDCDIIMSMVQYFVINNKRIDFQTFVIHFAYI